MPRPRGGAAVAALAGILNLLNTYASSAVHATGWDVLGGLALTPLLAAFALRSCCRSPAGWRSPPGRGRHGPDAAPDLHSRV
jgi:hypothetical protein